MRYSLGGAARAVGVHKATIYRAVKNGRLSAERLEDGTYAIDPAELARVYGGIDPATGASTKSRNSPQPSLITSATPRDGAESTLVAELRAELGRERESVDDLRRRLDMAEDRVTRLLLAIPAPSTAAGTVVAPPSAPVPTPVLAHRTGFLARLLGRS